MTAGAFHPSKISREPPPHGSPTLPNDIEPLIIGDRIAWPTIVMYEIDGRKSLEPLPPINFGSRSVAYKAIVTDRWRYDHLAATGQIRDERHTGIVWNEIFDRGKTS